MTDKKKHTKIIYSVSVCSEQKYKQLFSNSEKKPGQQVQKYHRLLISGLSSIENVDVDVISKLPITEENFKSKYIKKDYEVVDGSQYNYIPILNIGFLKNIFSFFYIFYYVYKFSTKRNAVIIGDVLNITASIANLIVGRIKGIPTIGIVTDVPTYLNQSTNKQGSILIKLSNKLISGINEFVLRKFDSYIFLTEQMNSLINKKNKPYLIMEGHVNINMNTNENTLKGKYEKKVCMYTGSLKEIYGIKMLTDAFTQANIGNAELHIYGDGDFKDELIKVCKKNKNIKYFGVKLNDYIVKEQIKATLLINPRPSGEEYTKYSFPSKNMEYMASGTATLTTRLPGMPKEYNEYVYLIEDESLRGLTNKLELILNKSKEELHCKGHKAKEFVLSKKNNVVQSSKIVELIKELS